MVIDEKDTSSSCLG